MRRYGCAVTKVGSVAWRMAAEKLSQVQNKSAPLQAGTKMGASAGGLASVSGSEFRICSRVCVVNATRTNEPA